MEEVTGGIFLACQRRAAHASKASWKKEKETDTLMINGKKGRGMRDVRCTGRWDFDGVKEGT